jgi:hypothetical protein
LATALGRLRRRAEIQGVEDDKDCRDDEEFNQREAGANPDVS